MVRVSGEVIRQMIEHALQQRPLESCGLLSSGDGGLIDGIRPCSNELASPDRFSIPPAELFEFFRGLRRGAGRFAGIYHSHPTTAARPSATDIENFHYPGVTYWIVSLAAARPELGCFDWNGDGFEPLDFHIEGRQPS